MTSTRRIVTPDLTSYIQGRKDDIKAEINCIAIGNVESFDTIDQTCTIQINYVRVITSGTPTGSPNDDDTTRKLVPYPQLVKCPLMILSGGNSYLTFPIVKGDQCVILFNDRDIDTWWNTGVAANPPNSSRLHDLSDALVFVGIRNIATALATYNMNGPQLTNGLSFIAVEDAIRLSVDGVTLREALDAFSVATIALANATDNPDIAAALAAAQLLIDGVLK